MLTKEQIDALLNSEKKHRAATVEEIQLLKNFLQAKTPNVAITNVQVTAETEDEISFSFSKNVQSPYQLSDSYFVTIKMGYK